MRCTSKRVLIVDGFVNVGWFACDGGGLKLNYENCFNIIMTYDELDSIIK